MKKIILAVLLVSGLQSFSQDTTSETASESSLDLGIDFQSRYIWRGLQLGGASSSAQPYLEFSSGDFAIGAWGAYSLGGVNGVQEADIYVTYSPSDALSFTITDYYFPTDGNLANNYFNYGGDATGHVFEAMVSFNGTDSFPVGLSVATNFGGADKNGDEQSYSTYVEASYSTTMNDVDFGIFAGAVFSDKGGYYLTDGSGLINLGISASKEVKITDAFSLPVNSALIFNPDQENIYLTFGFSL